jgi:predicted metal-dependent peptidase
MKFSRCIGKIDAKLKAQAEEKLSAIFVELGTRYDNDHIGSGMGGDPLIFSLIYPIDHICTLNIPTAATDGKRYYWNPKFVLKQSKIGLRIICSHEAWHAIYLHPQRRGSRIPKLWNIAVDYIVNGMCMEDFKARKMDPKDNFTKHLGKFITLKDYAEILKNPFGKIPEAIKAGTAPKVKMPKANEDRSLTEKEQKELERQEKKEKFYYADPDLETDIKRPEKIYDFLYNLLPKCPKCGRVGMYSFPKKNKDSEKNKEKGKEDGKNDSQAPSDQKNDQGNEGQSDCGHNHSEGESCDCPSTNGGGCDHCGDGFDIFGFGDTVDDHMDTSESEEKLAKRMAEALESARKMAGYIPGSLEDEIGKLTAPKVTWQDIIRTRLLKARIGHGRNDWTRFRSRPMFTGLLIPKRKSYFASFGCLLDTSGSMSSDDMAFGISQLQSLDERSEGVITSGDAEIYWDKSLKIKTCNADELSKIKPCGRGGTMFADYFIDYEKNIGKCDFLIIITDGYLMDSDVASMKDPGIPVIWLITSTCDFSPPFGRPFYLRS